MSTTPARKQNNANHKPAPLKQFTVIGKRTVVRRAAKSIQDLTKQLRAEKFVWQGIHEDQA